MKMGEGEIDFNPGPKEIQAIGKEKRLGIYVINSKQNCV